jgi:short-subunit dehydrogenase
VTGLGDRQRALITGASSGIGKAFACEFARRGFEVVLVARNEGRLRSTAREIDGSFGVKAVALVMDLADPKAPETLAQTLHGRGLEIDALVNNAGFGVPGMLQRSQWERHRDTIQVMATAPAHLAYLLTPGMIRRGQGWIVNISSLSAFLPPHAGGTLYYPVKTFLLQFSLAHAEEVGKLGVKVTAVCPGFTSTGFQDAAGGTVETVSMPRSFWLSPDRVAREGCDAVMRGDAICIPGRINRLIALAFKLMPRALGGWIVRDRSQ